MKELDDIKEVRFMLRSYLGSNDDVYKKRLITASPINNVTDNYHPVFICVGEIDPGCNSSVNFAKELEKHNIKHKLLVLKKEEYPKAKHAFLYFHYKCSDYAIKEAVKFMDVLKK